VLHWISPTDLYSKHHNIQSKRMSGTGQWLLETEQFQNWMNSQSPRNVLWCHGDPGAGKTIFTSLIIDHIRGHSTNGFRVSYFYFDYRDQESQTPTNLLASLIKQLIQQTKIVPSRLVKHYQKPMGGPLPSVKDLESALAQICNHFSNTYLIFDALDECDFRRHRKPVLDILDRLRTTSVRILITSRPHPGDIKRKFDKDPQITIRADDADIKAFIAHRIDGDNDISELVDEKLKEEIINGICAMSGGLFLLPALQIQFILEQTTRKGIKNALKRIPTALHDVLDEILTRIKQQPATRSQLATRALLLISHSKRPLTEQELLQALAISADSKSWKDDDLQEDVPLVKTVIDSCLGLVAVDEESTTVRLVHYSIQEYFQARAQNIFSNAECEFARLCLTFLLLDEFASGPTETKRESDRRAKVFPLLNYAATYWGEHLRGEPESELTELAMRFLESGHKFTCSLQAAAAEQSAWIHNLGTLSKHFTSSGLGLDNATPLNVAAKFGLESISSLLLEQGGIDPDSKDTDGASPLLHTLKGGHEKIARMLVDKGANPNVRDSYGYTTLIYASDWGMTAIVEFLIGSGVDIN
ncbi:hypothetical protein DL95DRAFT_253467, partial [Leptodontidium sp. 2 PMI_412]